MIFVYYLYYLLNNIQYFKIIWKLLINIYSSSYQFFDLTRLSFQVEFAHLVFENTPYQLSVLMLLVEPIDLQIKAYSPWIYG